MISGQIEFHPNSPLFPLLGKDRLKMTAEGKGRSTDQPCQETQHERGDYESQLWPSCTTVHQRAGT
jgi:hypothetical protein